MQKIVVLMMVGFLFGCSGTLDFSECKESADCGEGQGCSAEGYCVTLASLYKGPEMTNEVCPFVYGPIENENVILIGTIFPTSGASDDIGLPMEQAVTMAIDEFNEWGGVGPNAQAIAAVMCDSRGEDQRGQEAALHLESLGVKGVIGPAFSGVTIAVGTDVATRKRQDLSDGMVMISPSATNPGISELVDDDLIWRVVPSDALQARAIAQLLVNPEDWNLPVPPDFAVVYKEGPYGQGLKNELIKELEKSSTGFGTLRAYSYPDPNEYLADPSLWEPCDADGTQTCTDCTISDCCKACWFVPALAKLESESPDVVVLLGADEVAGIIGYVSSLWEKSAYPPMNWIVSEGGRVDSLFDEVEKYAVQQFGVSLDDVSPEKICGEECQSVEKAILSRIQGTTPSDPDGSTFAAFQSSFGATFGYGEPKLYSAHAYDATYLLLYAYSAALFNTAGGEVKTADLVSGLGQLQGGESVATVPDAISKGMGLLMASSSGGMNLTGASGPLDLNELGEPDYGPVSIWRPVIENRAFELTPVIDADGLLITSSSEQQAEEEASLSSTEEPTEP